MNHVYAKHIEQKNLRGYMVNGSVPFWKLFDAEEYCAQLNVPPDKDHLVYDPKNARICAIGLIPELERLRHWVDVQIAEAHEKIEAYAVERDRLKAQHSVLGDIQAKTTQEEIERLIGRSNALTESFLYLHERLYELRLLSWVTEQPE